VFDGALDVFLKYVPEEEKQTAVEQWYSKFAWTDWDTEDESEYYDEYLSKIIGDDDD